MITGSLFKAVLLGVIWPAVLAFIICAEFVDAAKDYSNILNIKAVFKRIDSIRDN